MRRAGFSLVELLIVVGLIGVFAAVGIPSFLRYQLRARSSEALTNLAGIALAQEARFAEFGAYVHTAAPVPASVPPASGTAWPGSPDFEDLGWAPDGSVVFQYVVTAADTTGTGGARRFTAEAASDIDGDGARSFFGYVKPALNEATGFPGVLPGSTCQASGVLNPGTGAADAIETAGPCDAQSGRSVF